MSMVHLPTSVFSKQSLCIISKASGTIYNSSETLERGKSTFLSSLEKALDAGKSLVLIFKAYITHGLKSIMAV